MERGDGVEEGWGRVRYKKVPHRKVRYKSTVQESTLMGQNDYDNVVITVILVIIATAIIIIIIITTIIIIIPSNNKNININNNTK